MCIRDSLSPQWLFSGEAKVAVQDPSYPVYVDSSVMFGRTGEINDESKQYADMVYMPCVAENGFFPDLEPAKDCQIIMFCNPNNPTGACATREQLQARNIPLSFPLLPSLVLLLLVDCGSGAPLLCRSDPASFSAFFFMPRPAPLLSRSALDLLLGPNFL